MIVNAVVKIRHVTKDIKRVEVHSPKYPMAPPLISLSEKYEGKPIKFVTCWSDIPIKNGACISINGSVIPDNIIGKCNLARGVCISCEHDDTVYIMMPQQLIA